MIMTTSWILFMVILRSTTGPYGRPMIEVAYRETLFSLDRGCMGDGSSGRVVGVSTCCRHVGHTQVNTSVGSTYLFLGFSFYKTYMHYVFKTKQNKTKTLVVSDLILTRRGSENVFRPPIGCKHIKYHRRFSSVLKD